jgi:hypothetical protein
LGVVIFELENSPLIVRSIWSFGNEENEKKNPPSIVSPVCEMYEPVGRRHCMDRQKERRGKWLIVIACLAQVIPPAAANVTPREFL